MMRALITIVAFILMVPFQKAAADEGEKKFCDGMDSLFRYEEVASCTAQSDNGVLRSLKVMQCLDEHGKMQPNAVVIATLKGKSGDYISLFDAAITTSYQGTNVTGLRIAALTVDFLGRGYLFSDMNLKAGNNEYVKFRVLDAAKTQEIGRIDATTYFKDAYFKCNTITSVDK
jgi:hypothetical protein